MTLFLILTFAISLAGFACIVVVPGAGSPESAIGLPFWLIMVWGPSLAAIILSLRAGVLPDLLARAVRVDGVPPVVWGLVITPLLLLWVLRPFAPDVAVSLGAGGLIAMVLFNLILGPMGEELGWRGVMQEHLNQRMGWLWASGLVGIVWFIWHVPLWWIDSPHAQISMALFAGHVMAML